MESLLNPNNSNLNDTERDHVIRRYLKEWGIDASGRRSPVDLLLSKLQRSDDPCAGYDEAFRTGWQPEALVVCERVLEHVKAGRLRAQV
ncbi:MAG: hypothetical protein GMKNLPBB_02001 [Myxococcota bacterium]|nr:hypothetical protein [Myxococcota bacterium]